jgi:DNA invertase Pin-like site-specific DNA recombinase
MKEPNRSGAVLYIRTAVSKQCDNGAQLQEQEALCRAYCATKGWSIEEVFVDSGKPGHTLSRPALNKLLSFCGKNRATVRYVVVEEFSRIARDPRLAVHLIMRLNRSYISLRSILSDPNVDPLELAADDDGEVSF